MANKPQKEAPVYAADTKRPVTVATLLDMKRKGLKVAMLTAYDYPTARIAEEAGVDVILVGDSVAMTKLGYDSTLPVTMDEMMHHVKAVKRGLSRALLVADMPYLSYELDAKTAAQNAGRFLKEGGAHAVKLEGGMEVAPIIKELIKVNVPVFGHLGLTPQAVNRLGGYRVQGRKPQDAERILTEARVLEGAGVCAVVLECVPAELAKEITKRLQIPTIGIGAGPNCDGQVLVSDDMLGLTEGTPHKFVKRYAELRAAAVAAAVDYCREVRDGSFPGPENSFTAQSMILWILASLLLLAAGVFGLCWWGSGVVLYPPAMSPMWIFPEQFGLPYEKIAFKTRDGIELKGWFIPSPNGDKRTLIMCHGWGDNKGELLKQTYFLNETAGFNLMYFDFRSHGESGGKITTIGGLETIDFDAAVTWLRANKPDFADRVGVFGLSMGAAVTVASMPDHPDLRCAVVESPYSDYKGVVTRWTWNHLRIPHFPLIVIAMWILRWRVGDPKVDSFNPVEAAHHISPRPLFVIGGDKDDLMPEYDVRRVFDAALEPKQLWIVPGAVHARCREVAGIEYDTRVAGFFTRNL